MSLLTMLFRDESAQDLAEYGIALAIIAAGAGLIALSIGGRVSTLWARGQSAIASVI